MGYKYLTMMELWPFGFTRPSLASSTDGPQGQRGANKCMPIYGLDYTVVYFM